MPRFLSRLMVSFLMVSLMFGLAGCDGMDLWLRSPVESEEGEVRLTGLTAPVTIQRDELGVPRIEAASEGDLAFGMGYVMASDRLAQMVSYSLVAQGRMSEMAGPVTRDLDVYMRTLGVRRNAEQQMAQVSPALQKTCSGLPTG